MSGGGSACVKSALLPVMAAVAGLSCAHAASDSSSIDACALLQPAEIARVLPGFVADGVRRDAGVESNGAYSSSCVWVVHVSKPPQPEERLILKGRSYVILNAMQWPAGAGKAGSFLASFHEAKASGVLTGELVPKSFGDEALWWGDGLAIRRRDMALGLSVHDISGSAVPGASEEQLAPLLLQRIDARDARLGRIAKAR
ncbi:MAG: hypothetical protein ABW278_12255 [Steroidobacteraceae bacterium]